MDPMLWIMLYALGSLVCIWLLFWGGARWLEAKFVKKLVVFRGSVRSTGLRLLGWVLWLGETAWFLLGLAFPAARGA